MDVYIITFSTFTARYIKGVFEKFKEKFRDFEDKDDLKVS